MARGRPGSDTSGIRKRQSAGYTHRTPTELAQRSKPKKKKSKPSPKPPPSKGPYAGAHPGGGGGYIPKKQRKHIRHGIKKARERGAYQGTLHPSAPARTKKEKRLQRRGKAVRKIQRGKASHTLIGKTKYRKLVKGQTGRLRELQILTDSKAIRDAKRKIRNPKTDPQTKLTLQSRVHTYKSDKRRLYARRHLANAYHAEKTIKGAHDSLTKIERQKKQVRHQAKKLYSRDYTKAQKRQIHRQAHKQLRQLDSAAQDIKKGAKSLHKYMKNNEAQAKEQFKQSRRANEKAARLAAAATDVPAAKRVSKPHVVTNKASVERQRRLLGLQDPFATTRGAFTRKPHVKKHRVPAKFYTKGREGAQPFFGAPTMGVAPGKYTRGQLRAIGKQTKQTRELSSPAQDLLMAAEIGTLPLAPEALALKLGTRGIEALRATRLVRGAEKVAEGARATRAGRALARTTPAQRAAEKRFAKSQALRDLKIPQGKRGLFRGPLPKLEKTPRRTSLGTFTKGTTYKTPAKLAPRGPGVIARRKAAAEVAVNARKETSLTEHEVKAVSKASRGLRAETKTASKQVDSLRGASKAEKAAIRESETAKPNIAGTKAARDKRAIAGAGDSESIHRQMWDDILMEMRARYKPTRAGLALRTNQAIKGGAIFASPMVALTAATRSSDPILNSWRDAHDLVIGFVPSTVQLLTASGQALWYGTTAGAHGDTSRISAIWDGIKETDPIALAVQGRFDEAYHAMEERPISAGIELGGSYAAVGRTVGRVGRGLPESLRFGGTGGREPFGLSGTAVNHLEYSENFFTKLAQIGGEKLQKRYLSPQIEKRMTQIQRDMDFADTALWTDKTELVPTETVHALPRHGRVSKYEAKTVEGEGGVVTEAKAPPNIEAGIVKPIVLHQRKDGSLFVYDGRKRLDLAAEQGFESVPVTIKQLKNGRKVSPSDIGLDTSTNMFPLESSVSYEGAKGLFGGGMRDVYAKHIANRRRIELEKAMDEAFSIAYIGQRTRRAEVERELGKLAKRANQLGYDNGHQALWFVATKIARSKETAIQDVADHLTNLRKRRQAVIDKSAYREEGPQALEYLNHNIDATEQVLADTAMLKDKRIWDLADEFQKAEAERQIKLIEGGNLLPHQARYAPWIPYIVRHMKGRYNETEKGFYWKRTVSADRSKERKIFVGEAHEIKNGQAVEEATHFKRKNLVAQGDDGDFVIAYDKKTGKIYEIADSEWESSAHIKGSFKAQGTRELKKPVTLEDIRLHAEEAGVEGEPAMITSRFLDGSNQHEFRGLGIPDPFNQQSHGNAIIAGTADNSFTAFQRQAILSQSTIDKTNMYTGLLDRVAIRAKGSPIPLAFKAEGKLSAKQVADKFIKDQFGGTIGEDFTAVNMRVFRDELRDLETAFLTRVGGKLKGKDAYNEMDQVLNTALKMTKKGDPEAEYWVVPSKMIERLQKHAEIEAKTGNLIRAMNREFKGSVLAFSVKWHTGNIVDMATRLFFEGAGPTSYIMGRRILRQMERDPATKEAWYDTMALIGGGHLSHADNSLEDFTKVGAGQRELQRAAQMRALSTSLRLGTKGYNAIFDTLRTGYRGAQRGSFWFGQLIERHMRYAAFGKAVKSELRRKNWSYMDRNFMAATRLQPKVIEETIQGLQDTEIQRKLATHVNRVMGDYTTMSPEFRNAMLNIAPFALWARASVKWVLSLPMNSPVRVSMVTMVNRWNEPERRKLGLSALTQKEHLPFYMLGAVAGSMVGGAASTLYRTNSYTSFGPLTEGNPAAFVLPQVSNLLQNLNGIDWTGQQLINRNGKPVSQAQRYGIALQSLLETYVQPLAMAHTIWAHGEPDPTFTLFSWEHATHPGSIAEDAAKRRFSMQQYRDPNEPLRGVPVETDPLSTSASIMKTTLPFYPSENFLVTQRQQDAAAKKAAKQGKTGELVSPDSAASPSAVNWLGEPINPKRKKKAKGYNPPNQAGSATGGSSKTNWLGQPMK